MKKRKCCDTPQGDGRHKAGCQNAFGNISPPGQGRRKRQSKRDKKATIAVLNEVAADVSDGVFWAIADEMGIEAEDLI